MFLKNLENANVDLVQITRIHLIGAGGIGMSGLKVWLDELGYVVSCSDDAAHNDSFLLESEMPVNAECVVVSSAIKNDHPQYIYALENGIPVIHRSFCTKMLMTGTVVAVSGAHGKSTSSALLAFVLNKCLRNVSFLIGAVLQDFNVSAKLTLEGYESKTGRKANDSSSTDRKAMESSTDRKAMESSTEENNIFVVEADESDGSMNVMNGEYHLLTNLNEEHMDYYKTTLQYYKEMNQFASSCKYLICHYSCKEHVIRADVIWYGHGSSIYPINVRMSGMGSVFDIIGPWGIWRGIKIKLYGNHMIDNVTGCVALMYSMGLDETQIRNGLAEFSGVQKRMERFDCKDIIFIQDYAHHPTEVDNVVKTIRSIYPNSTLHVIWEPHKFSRLTYKDNYKLFVEALKNVDALLVLPVWTAGEPQGLPVWTAGESERLLDVGLPVWTAGESERLLDVGISARTARESEGLSTELNVRFSHNADLQSQSTLVLNVSSVEDIFQYCREKVKPKDIVLAMGAGGVHKIMKKVMNKLSDINND